MKRNGERELKRGLNLNAEERSYLITAVVVACAIAARVISKAGIAADTMGLIRSVLYIGLYFVWGISIKKRVMQAQVQRYLTAIVGMMIFWFIVRTMKYFFSRTLMQRDICGIFTIFRCCSFRSCPSL